MADTRFGQLIVLGSDHRLQSFCPAFTKLEHKQEHERQQRRFATEVVNTLVEHNIAFIGEEVGHKQESILQHLARAFGCSYANIEMPMPLRIRERCGPLYAHEVSKDDFGSEAEWQKDVQRCHGLREEYMAKRVLEFLEPGAAALIVCGQVHRDPLANRLRPHAEEVFPRSVAQWDWFDRSLYGWPPG